MKIVLLSDIHSNLPALEAALITIDQQKPDAIYCLGDLVGYNIWSNEVIAEVKKRNIPTIAGNHDIKVEKLEVNPDLQNTGKDYSYHILNNKGKEYLRSLPSSFNLSYPLKDGDLKVVLVHGSPRSVNEYLLEDMDEAYLLELANEVNADVLCFGHTHKPFYKAIAYKDRYVHFINTGSIGKPKDGNVQGGYVQLKVNKEFSLSDKDCISVEFIRFDYDIETAAKAVENSPLPDEFADQLRRAY